MRQHVIHMWSDVLQVFMWLNHCSDQTIQWPKVNTALIYEMMIKFEHYTSPSWKLAACWCQPICLSKHWYSNMTKDVPSMHHMAAFKWTLNTLCDQLFKSISTTSLLSIFQKTICTSSKQNTFRCVNVSWWFDTCQTESYELWSWAIITWGDKKNLNTIKKQLTMSLKFVGCLSWLDDIACPTNLNHQMFKCVCCSDCKLDNVHRQTLGAIQNNN
jgi:hypothetical protein